MKRILFFILLIHTATLCFSQLERTCRISNFSDKYYAQMYLQKTDTLFSSGAVVVYDKLTHKELVRARVKNLEVSLNWDEAVRADIVKVPYNEQSAIVCGDFNCDGIEDIAIQTGDEACYGRLLYNVFIAKKGKLVADKIYTNLAQAYCGFPDIDCEAKTILTTIYSGCCWQELKEFDIVYGKPVLSKIIQKGFAPPYVVRNVTSWKKGKKETEVAKRYFSPLFLEKTVTTWVNNKEEKKTSWHLNASEGEILFKFQIAENKKEVMVIQLDDNIYYCLAWPNGEVESYYPQTYYEKDEDKFCIENNNALDMLSFSDNNTKYMIYNSETEVGIRTVTEGRTNDMPGILSSRNGTFGNIRNSNATNIFQ